MVAVEAEVRNQDLIDWVDGVAAMCKPERVHWCDGVAGGVRRAVRADGRERDVHPPERRAATELVPVPLRSGRRRPGRGPDVHLLGLEDRRRPHQQLARAARDEGPARAALPGRDARADDVRDPVLDGADRLAARAHRRRAHRLALRRRQHADHDPHGHRGARRPGRRRLRPLPALGRRAARAGRGRRRLAVQPGREVHRPLPRGARRSGRTDRATAATPCSARSASPCGSPRCWPATRAGWPSTC